MAINGQYIERSLIKSFDFALLGITIALCSVGVGAIYSATLQSESVYLHELYARQSAWVFFSLVVMAVVIRVDYRVIERFAYLLFFLGIISLVMVEISGKTVGGSQRWLSMGGFNLQPSELVKVIVIIACARILDDMDKDGGLTLIDLLKPAILISIPFMIVATQPDLGTAIIYFIILAGIAFINGVHRNTLVGMASALAFLAPVAWYLLKPYQKTRILTLLNPEADPMGRGYHIIQSKIAVGSGGLWGKGIFNGTQSKLNFLPEKHTDFIFSVVAEEVGFFGSMLLIALFFFLVMRIIDTAIHSKDKFGSLIAGGVATMFSFNIIYNIGMTLGLFPIVGVPLPFISYGGSSLLTNFVAIGLVLNISMRRFSVK